MSHAQPLEIADSLSSEPAPQTAFDFYALPRAIQDRFVASSRGAGAPAAILFRRYSSARANLWLLGAAVSLGLVLVLMVLGWGVIESSLSLQPRPLGLLYIALCGLAGVCLTFFLNARDRPKHYPYQLGAYLFPAGVVVANDQQLRLHLWSTLKALTVDPKRATFTFAGGRFTFPLTPDLTPEKLRADIDEYKARYAEAALAGNRRELAVLDPLRDSGFSNPLSSNQSLAREVRSPLVRLVALGVAGAAIGALLFLARNKLAERSLYAAVRKVDTVSAYQAYLERGGRRPEVAGVLLPIAELRDARGSLDRVEAYAAAHPRSRIKQRIDAALREELLVALKDVEQAQTLAAIADFKEHHATHAMIAAELAQARHAVFEAARKRYVDGAQSGLTVQQLIGELLDYAEAHGPRVEIRLRPQIPVSIDRADNLLRKSAYFVGNKSLPSQYFSRKYAEPREQGLLAALIEHLQSPFPKEILEFVEGPSVDPSLKDLPEATLPTLFISYKSEMSGAYTTQSPRGVFVGLSLMVHTEFQIPGRAKPFVLRRYSKWTPPDTSKIYLEKLTPEQVYGANAQAGFDGYLQRVLSIFVPETLDSGKNKK